MKYAIYKNNIGGLYEMDYIDNLDDCKNYMFGPFIKEDRLPIVINMMGGYHSFIKDDKNFVKFIECNEDINPLKLNERYPINVKNFKFGWISPDGITYHCGATSHTQCAIYICKEFVAEPMNYGAEKYLEKQKWIKTYKDSNREFSIYIEGGHITKQQYETLCDLGYSRHEYVKRLVRRSENNW